YIGIVAEHLRLIEEMTQLEIEMSPSATWTESTEKAKQGLVDILSETDDSDLKSHLHFTHPYISNPIVIAMRHKENFVESIEHIKGKRIALIKDYGYASKIRKKYSDIEFVTVSNIQDGLISVSTGSVDALLCTLALCSYTISELGINNVKITGKTEFDTKLAFGVQKNLPELHSILNKAIKQISPGQQQVILDGWIKDRFPEKIDYTLTYQVAVAAIVLLIIFASWVRRLSREVSLRIQTEKELTTAETVLRLSNQRLLLHRKYAPVGLIEWNTDQEILDWNPAAQNIFGFSNEEVIGSHITEIILPKSMRESADRSWADLIANKDGNHSINSNLTKDGRTILCEWHNTPLVDEGGCVIGVTSIVEDITERKKHEENQRQSQKMDAIGKLTGGIAHDFNNMLGVILGFSALLKKSLTKDETTQRSYCDEIHNAGERAEKLTKKLLEFSRVTPSTAEATQINLLLDSMQHMLEKTLTYRIKLSFEVDDDLWMVWLDKARLEDAILNMCINAMHAMPDGGGLTLGLYNKQLTDFEAYPIGIPPGDYVLLSVADTGGGMSEEVQQKLFDPFFTTKGASGTGLGMSQVYGFVQQSGASIRVFSELGFGSRLDIFFPKYTKTESNILEIDDISEPASPSGDETILVVEDEAALLMLTEKTLQAFGYTVKCARNAEEAMLVLQREAVDLMLSDVVMPGKDGYQLASEVEKLYPKVKIQIISGFSEEHRASLVNDALHQSRLQKPVSAEKLLVRIRSMLDDKAEIGESQ
ncbi:MAG: transporter substrate-binding domain-containing protein, partial [Gammaproteobacteria bacterium]|nr:transporter substrate-binding domain-containing protein [Gammaproteobacteria bacterium]